MEKRSRRVFLNGETLNGLRHMEGGNTLHFPVNMPTSKLLSKSGQRASNPKNKLYTCPVCCTTLSSNEPYKIARHERSLTHQEQVRSLLKAGVCPIHHIFHSSSATASCSHESPSSFSSPMELSSQGKSLVSNLVSPPPSPGRKAHEEESQASKDEQEERLREKWMDPFYPHGFQWSFDEMQWLELPNEEWGVWPLTQ